tara:strand:- start:1496 stop:2209 length:714 start_codon:yes stop_codon:yes gene_type:complete
MTNSAQLTKKPKGILGKVISLVVIGLFINVLYVECIYGYLGFKKSYVMQSKSLQAIGTVIEKNETIFSAWLQEKIYEIETGVFKDRDSKYQKYLLTQIDQKTKGIFKGKHLPEKALEGFKWVKRVVSEQGFLMAVTIKILVGKLFLLILSLPLFILTTLVGFVDGLSAREIRKSELGRESSYVFHRLSGWVMTFIGVSLLIWFVLPLPINPSQVFLPLCIILMFSIRMASSRFKKYL